MFVWRDKILLVLVLVVLIIARVKFIARAKRIPVTISTMATVSNYEPCLSLKAPFDPSSDDKVKIYTPIPGGEGRTASDYIRKLTGTSVEEVCYTIRIFEDHVKNMSLPINQYIRKFVTLLGPTPRSKWNAMVANRATAFPATSAGWASAKHAYLEVFTEDPDARETLLATFYDNSTFAKQSETSVADHEVRISELCDYIDMLPRPANVDNLSSIKRRNLFYNTFPKTWREEYARCNTMTSETTQQQIKEYMYRKKRSADKDHQRNKKDNGQKQDQKKHGKGGKGKGGKPREGGAICRIHGGHLWKDCYQNPKNKDSPYNMGRGGGRGYFNNGGRGRGGRGGRGYQGRGFNNGGRGNNNNAAISIISNNINWIRVLRTALYPLKTITPHMKAILITAPHLEDGSGNHVNNQRGMALQSILQM